MEVELKRDIIYLPSGEHEVKSIWDIIHYEAEYGKAIYERPKGVGKKVKIRKSKNVVR